MANTKPKKRQSKKPIVDWRVDITFETHDVRVRARTPGEAKRKAAAKLMRKGYGLVDKRNTYADKF